MRKGWIPLPRGLTWKELGERSRVSFPKGNIPGKFLLGCGLTDLEIESAKLANPNLSKKQVTDITYKIYELYTGGISVQYYSLFISYSSKDQKFTQRLHDDLQNNGVRCWFAPENIIGGEAPQSELAA